MGRIRLAALLLSLFVTGCAVPKPSDYVRGGAAGRTGGVDLGQNAAGESCTQQVTGDGAADVYCGTWTQPSGRVRQGGAADSGSLRTLATASPWRSEIDGRFTCGEPTPATVLGDAPAVVMQCNRRVGGWPHVAFVALVGSRVWFADGVLPAQPAVERAVGVMSGRLPATAAAHTPASDALLGSRLAARSFGSGDIGQYENLMILGSTANGAEDFPAAEQAYRGALSIQQKLGPNNPAAALPMALLALQLSNQQRVTEADGLMARADRLAASATVPEPGLAATLIFTRAQMQDSRGRPAEALALFQQADAAYTRQLPPAVLYARPRPTRALIVATTLRANTAGIADTLPSRDILTDPATRNALLGLIETRRRESLELAALGRREEAAAMLRAAEDLATGNQVRVPVLDARLSRTLAAQVARQGKSDQAAQDFGHATTQFAVALPQTRPVAETYLLQAAELAREQRNGEALDACKAGIGLLRKLRAGTEPKLLEPCLTTMLASAGQSGGSAQQALLGDMFEAAQLAQGSVTSQQIALATARLGENARDPKVAEAIRAREAANETLAGLLRQRDAAALSRGAGEEAPPVDPALQDRIARAEQAAADADAALQAASPNFGQLVQQVAPAHDVLTALRPGEAFAAIDLAPDGGFVFVLRDNTIAVGRVHGGEAAIADKVKRVRASIEADPLPAFDTDDAAALYRDVFGDVSGAMDGITALVVAPTGPLLSLPFAVLLTGPAKADSLASAPWLLRRATIAHVPAAANFVSLRRIAGSSRATRPWFGFGDFRPVTKAEAERSFPPATCGDSAALMAGLPPLPYAVRELAAARALTGAAPGDELLGAAFTAPAVLAAPLKDTRILHFATHALLPTDLHCQGEPAIVTSAPAGAKDASGALLTAAQVRDMDLDADAVILSACNSGGPAGGEAGQSLSGLARSFFYAGARALVVTHWSVNDQTAAYLVADSLRRMRQGSGAAAAMRAAQLGMLDQAGRGFPADIAHPFYWAPFALIGEGGVGARATAAAAGATGL